MTKKHPKKWLLPATLCLLVLLVSLKMFSIPILNSLLSISAKTDNYAAAHNFSNAISFLNIFEPYIAPFNRGNIYFYQKDYESAKKSYTESLSLNPPIHRECQIRGNLALSISAQADILSEQKNYSKALISYDQASSTLLEKNCVKNTTDENTEEASLSNLYKNITQKQSETVQLLNDDPVEENTNSGSKDNLDQKNTPSQDKIDALKKQQESSETTRNRKTSSNNYEYIYQGERW